MHLHTEDHPSTGPPGPFLSRLLWALLLLACAGFVLHAVRWAAVPTHGFANYYVSSRFLLAPGPFADSYRQETFDSVLSRSGMGAVRDVPYNMPTNALMLLPVAWLPAAVAKSIWTCCLVLLYGLSVFLLLRINNIKPSSTLGLLLAAYAFVYHPAYENITWGQMYVLLLFLFTAMLLFIKEGRALGSALPLAAAIVLKGYGLVILLWQLLRRRWRPLLWCAGLVTVAVAATIPVFGIGSWEAWVQRLSEAQPGNIAYQTIPGIYARYAGGTLGAVFAGAALPIVGILMLRFKDEPLLEASAALGLNVVTAPLAESYHYLLFLPLIFALAARLPNRLYLVLPAILVALPANSQIFENTPYELLGYNRLAAGIALVGLVLYVERSSKQQFR